MSQCHDGCEKEYFCLRKKDTLSQLKASFMCTFSYQVDGLQDRNFFLLPDLFFFVQLLFMIFKIGTVAPEPSVVRTPYYSITGYLVVFPILYFGPERKNFEIAGKIP